VYEQINTHLKVALFKKRPQAFPNILDFTQQRLQRGKIRGQQLFGRSVYSLGDEIHLQKI
jgi:hypothetical protein